MKIIGKLNKFWFSPLSPDRLSLFRIIVGLYCFFYFSLRFYNSYETFGTKPIYLFKQVGIVNFLNTPLDLETFKVVIISTIILNVLFIFGLFFRITGPIFSMIYLFSISYTHS